VEDLHRELARIAFAAGDDLGLTLAGGYAIRAHGLTERPSGDLDLATSANLDLRTIVDRLSDTFRRSGFDVQLIESKLRMARLQVTRTSMRESRPIAYRGRLHQELQSASTAISALSP
jgi:hypothetical protein